MMFLDIASSVKNSFSDFFFSILYALIQAVFQLIDAIQEIFMFLAGGGTLSFSGNGYSGKDGNSLLTGLIESDAIKSIFLMFLFVGIFCLITCYIIGLIRASMQKDTVSIGAKMLFKLPLLIIFMLTLPLIFYAFTSMVSSIFSTLVECIAGELASEGSADSTIAQGLFVRCFNKIVTESGDPEFTNPFNFLKNQGYNMGIDGDFNYFLALVCGFIILFSLGLAAIGLIERLINILLLYIISPVIIGTIPLDEGARFNVWKDLVLSKIFGAMGNILSMYMYLIIMRYMSQMFMTVGLNSSQQFVLNLLYAFVAIGGSLLACKGSQLIATIVSHTAGQQEGISQLATQGLIRGGMNMTGQALNLGLNSGKVLLSGRSGFGGSRFTGLAPQAGGGIIGGGLDTSGGSDASSGTGKDYPTHNLAQTGVALAKTGKHVLGTALSRGALGYVKSGIDLMAEFADKTLLKPINTMLDKNSEFHYSKSQLDPEGTSKLTALADRMKNTGGGK